MNNYLLDTHVILWWLGDDPKLSDAAREAISDPTNTIYASAVSGYEIAWKSQLGRLDVPFQNPADFTRAWQQEHWLELPLSLNHAVQAGRFSSPHRDPFDRQLAAQATCDHLTLITIDPAFSAFLDLTIFW